MKCFKFVAVALALLAFTTAAEARGFRGGRCGGGRCYYTPSYCYSTPRVYYYSSPSSCCYTTSGVTLSSSGTLLSSSSGGVVTSNGQPVVIQPPSDLQNPANYTIVRYNGQLYYLVPSDAQPDPGKKKK